MSRESFEPEAGWVRPARVMTVEALGLALETPLQRGPHKAITTATIVVSVPGSGALFHTWPAMDETAKRSFFLQDRGSSAARGLTLKQRIKTSTWQRMSQAEIPAPMTFTADRAWVS